MNEKANIVMSLVDENENCLRKELDVLGDNELEMFPVNSVSGGDAVLWVTLANLAVSSLPVVWDVLKRRLDQNKVSSIEIYGVKIDNPTSDLVKEVLDRKFEKNSVQPLNE